MQRSAMYASCSIPPCLKSEDCEIPIFADCQDTLMSA